MKKITVNASKKYQVLIGDGILPLAGEYFGEVFGEPRRVLVLTDDNVAPLYLRTLTEALEAKGFQTESYIIPNGEASKNTENLINLLEYMAEKRFTRSDVLASLGGGVIGDLGGLAASLYGRGIAFVQLPTTLLAAVDSSVGGKTAVDLKAGKNLMGAFWQPSLVICDYTTLDTLPPQVFSDGCAEVIKYGAINDIAFFHSLEGGIRENIEDVIAECVKNKARIVENDEFDKGERQLLNLGHTIGHAIELLSEFAVSHGSAVSIGMTVVTRAACNMGICPEEDLEKLIKTLTAAGLPTACPYGAREMAEVAKGDKKRAGDTISLVVPYGIGNSKLLKVPVGELENIISKGLDK